MNKSISALTIAIVCCLTSITGSWAAPVSEARFDNFTQEDGLSNNMVQCIYQDKEGWMWFGSSQGLNRYDGYKFRTYRSDDGSSHAMMGSLVRCVYQDKKGNYWVGTENGGLNKFDLHTESFTKIRIRNSNKVYSANSICEDRNGRLWVGTEQGLCYLDNHGNLQYYNVQSDQHDGLIDIKKILVDKQNNLWIGSSKQGLFWLNVHTKEFKSIDLPGGKLRGDEVQTIYQSKDGIIWIGTYYSGVYYVPTGSLTVKPLGSFPSSERQSTVRSIIEDKEGHLWFGTRGGLICYDRPSGKYNVFKADIGNNIALIQNSVLSLYIDTKGDLWAGTRGGISYLNHEKQIFHLVQEAKNDSHYLNDEEVYGFAEDNQGRIWIGTESGGINIRQPHTDNFTYITRSNGLSTDCIKCFLNNGNEMWVGTYMGGINIVDSHSLRVKKILRSKVSDPHSLISDDVWFLLKDSRGTIWAATAKGIDKYDGKGGFVHMPQLAHDVEVVHAFEDHDHDLWFCAYNEVIIYNPRTDRITRYPERCRVVYQDKENRFWLGTFTKGLALYNKYSGAIAYFGENKGLSNNCVQTISENGNYLWVTTNNGLSRFEKKTHTIKNYDKNDGLQDAQFHYNAAYKTHNGEILLGGIHGLNIFNPNIVHDNTFVPPIELNEFRIFNKVIGIGKELEENISTAKKITLRYDQNMFTIQFAALSYSKSQKNQYMYKMEGFDKDWIISGTKNSATYTNLDPGTYTFMVKGANCDGKWSTTTKTITIEIEPPFYRTWWFELLMLAVLSYLTYYIANFYLHKAKLKNALEVEKARAQKIKEVEEMKLQFFTNISHELRTPLTLILGPLSQILQKKNLDDETVEDAQMAEKNANQLLKLVNQLLDFRKIEAGKIQVSYSAGDISSFVGNQIKSFASMAEAKNITLAYHSAVDHLYVMFDDDKMQKICNNLLSNAIKYTQEGGHVDVTLNLAPQHKTKDGTLKNCYSLTFSDNGQGILKENLERVFEAFEQNSASDSAKGTGIGLSITRDFIKLMEGEISVDSEPGKGTTFHIYLPELTTDAQTQEQSTEGNINNTPDTDTNTDSGQTSTEENKENAKILLIAEDNEDLRHFISRYFSKKFMVIEAADGEEALKQATEKIPDAVLTDLIMPKMKGDELCQKLKADERTSHIPIIMLTAINAHDTEIETLKAGADDYITKPFDINILEQKLHNQIERQESLKKKFKYDQLLQPKQVEVESPDERFMRKAMEIIEKNISDPDFDIEQFASEVGVSRMQLYRKIDAMTNMTVKEFIRNIRIKRAFQMIEQGKLTISEVAYDVGFKDIAYFRKCFKAQIGINPSEVPVKKEG